MKHEILFQFHAKIVLYKNDDQTFFPFCDSYFFSIQKFFGHVVTWKLKWINMKCFAANVEKFWNHDEFLPLLMMTWKVFSFLWRYITNLRFQKFKISQIGELLQEMFSFTQKVYQIVLLGPIILKVCIF